MFDLRHLHTPPQYSLQIRAHPKKVEFLQVALLDVPLWYVNRVRIFSPLE